MKKFVTAVALSSIMATTILSPGTSRIVQASEYQHCDLYNKILNKIKTLINEDGTLRDGISQLEYDDVYADIVGDLYSLDEWSETEELDQMMTDIQKQLNNQSGTLPLNEVYEKKLMTISEQYATNKEGRSMGTEHERQDLGIFLKGNSQLEMRIKENYDQPLVATIFNNEDMYRTTITNQWTTVDVKKTGALFMETPYSSSKGEPVVEFRVTKGVAHSLPIYTKNNSQNDFLKEWEDSHASYGLIRGNNFQMLVTAHDLELLKERNLDEIISNFDDKIFAEDNALTGIDTNTSLTPRRPRYFLSVDRTSMGMATYQRYYTSVTGSSIKPFLGTGWATLHEIAHGYEFTSNNSNMMFDVINNIYGTIYQKNTMSKDEFQNSSWVFGKNKAGAIQEAYKQFENHNVNHANYGVRLISLLNLFNYSSLEKTFRDFNKWHINYSLNHKHDDISTNMAQFMASYAKVNIAPYFEYIGLNIDEELKKQLYNSELPAIYPLAKLVPKDCIDQQLKNLGADNDVIKNALSLVNNNQIDDTTKQKVTLSIEGLNDDDTIELKDGNNVVQSVKVENHKAIFNDIPNGIYTLYAKDKHLKSETYIIVNDKDVNETVAFESGQIQYQSIFTGTINIQAKDRTLKKGQRFDALEGVTAKSDSQSISVSVIDNDVNTSIPGRYAVTYQATNHDLKANKTIYVTVGQEENQAPVIEAQDITFEVGTDYNYLKDVIATDLEDGILPVQIEKSNIDKNKVGDYELTYSATDHDGRQSMKTINVHVIEKNEITEDMKDDADKKLQSYSWLSDEERNAVMEKIKNTKKETDYQHYLEEAQKENEKRLKNAQAETISYLYHIKDLSSKENEEIQSHIQKATTQAELTTIVLKTKDAVIQRVTQAYEQARQYVLSEKELNNDEELKVFTALDHIQTVNEAKTIQSRVQDESEKRLSNAKEKATSMVNKMDQLTEDQRATVNDEIKKANTSADIDMIVSAVEAYQQTEQANSLKIAKTEAMKQLEGYDMLSKDEIAQSNDAIQGAKTKENVAIIISEVTKIQYERFNQLKQKTIANIEQLDLEDSDRQQLLAEINQASTKRDVEELAEQAKTMSHNLLQKHINQAKKEITSYIHLQQKDDWIQAIEKATTVSEVTQLLQIAKQADQWYENKTINKAKEEAKKILLSLMYLTIEEQQRYLDKIEKISKVDDFTTIVIEAIEVNNQHMEEVKEFENFRTDMKIAVDQLEELQYLEREAFKEEIDQAKTKHDIQVIFDKAQKKNTENAVNKAIEIATKTIYSLTGLTKSQQQNFITQVKQANSVDEVNRIVSEAKKQENSKKPIFHKEEHYIHFNKSTYTLWKDLTFKEKKGLTKNYMNQTLKMKGYYNVENRKYASIYNYDNQWLGYVNMDNVVQDKNAGGVYHSYNRYVTIVKDNYTLWKDFDFKAKKGQTKSMEGHTYYAKGYYKHINGSTYYSIYDRDNHWLGYLNYNAAKLGKNDGRDKVGIHQPVKKTMKVKRKNYTLWSGFDFTDKKGNTTSWYNKTVYIGGQYEYYNGTIYYSVYDKKGGRWLGYVNQNAMK